MRALILIAAGSIACSKARPEARKLVPPSAQEAVAFAKEFAAHISPCEADELDRLVDRELIIARAVANRHVSDAELRGFRSTFGGIGTVLCRQLADQTNVQASFLRIHTVDGAPRPLIRLLQDGALNYYELDLDSQRQGVRAADITIYMAGERISELVGKLLDMLKGEGSETAATLTTLSEHVNAREWTAAHALLNTLPAKIREHKAMRLMEVQISAELGDAAYREAMDAYAKAFPDDPSLALVEIDHAILQKRYAEAARHIDALDRIVGGDPYLDSLRADIAGQQGKYDAAVTLAARAAERAPELIACWWQLLTQQAAAQRYEDAIPTLATLRDRFGQDVSAAALAGDARFEQLATSAAYLAWVAR